MSRNRRSKVLVKLDEKIAEQRGACERAQSRLQDLLDLRKDFAQAETAVAPAAVKGKRTRRVTGTPVQETVFEREAERA